MGEYGECSPLSDEDFYKLMTMDKGQANPKMVELTLKYYPELSRFAKSSASVSLESINELLAQYSLPELEFPNCF